MNDTTLQESGIAILAGGCFWCLEAVFKEVAGVHAVQPGYIGGQLPEPTYRQVCGGESGHAEVVKIVFDPQRIEYRSLLEIFFAIHDPTTRDRQGDDVGPQYRSAIFALDDGQALIAHETIAALGAARAFGAPVVTEVVPATHFWPAEDYHRDYFAHNPKQPYCQRVVAPKLNTFRQKFTRYRRL